MPHAWLPQASVVVTAAVEAHLDVQRQAVAKDPSSLPTCVGRRWATSARRRMAKALVGMKRNVDDFARRFLHELWGKYFLRKSNTHTNKKAEQAM